MTHSPLPKGSWALSRSLARGLLVGALAARGAAQELPAGFIAEAIGSQWTQVMRLCYLDERRLLVAERDGRVWYVLDDQRKNLVYDIVAETQTNGDRGLLAIAAAPDFELSGWLYLLFVVAGGGPGVPSTYGSLIRVRTEFDAQGDLLALPTTREYLLGDRWSTGIPSCAPTHAGGSLRFLSDGSLVLTSGDGAHQGFADAGGRDDFCFRPGRTPADEDLGAFRSQYDNSLCGKVLRLDPETGRGLPDNPFFTGDASEPLSRVYARGLRNPFRFTLLPGSGPREALLIADVGWLDWEEINLCLGGENFGWPCFEGQLPQPSYRGADERGVCAGIDTSHVEPLLTYHHGQSGPLGFRGNCATGLAVYTGERYPPLYRGRLFFTDYERNWVRAARLGADLVIRDSIAFGRFPGGTVDLVSQPGSGDLVYASLANGVFRLRYVGAQLPPRAVASATPASGAGDLEVQLSAAGSSDPENQPLSYAWDLGDGLTYTEREFTHVFTGEENVLVRVTVTDTEGLSDSAEVLVSPDNTPPVIDALLAPLDGALFVAGEPMRFAATAHDAEDGTPKATWTLDLVHDHHVHPGWAAGEGLVTELTPDSHGAGDNHFVVRLAVTDARDLRDERAFEIFDAHSYPQAHLVELPESRVRVGQRLAPVGHFDYSSGRVTGKQATLTWDWGDGTLEAIPGALHQIDTRPTHVYREPGTYKLRLIADLEGHQDLDLAVVEVGPPRPALAVFTPLDEGLWVSRSQQEEIVASLQAALVSRTSEVRAFSPGQGEALASWMESLVSDSIADVLVLLDGMPAATVPEGITGSLLERWIAGGNGLVWTGATPFQAILSDDGTSALAVSGAETFFSATGSNIVLGGGAQSPTALGASVTPSLLAFQSSAALRTLLLGPPWRVARLFAEGIDGRSDGLELEHASRGFYAQFLCDDAPGLPRAAVLGEYLLDKLAKSRLGSPAPVPVRR
jgi:glucose/arabinose dehydrogenase